MHDADDNYDVDVDDDDYYYYYFHFLMLSTLFSQIAFSQIGSFYMWQHHFK